MKKEEIYLDLSKLTEGELATVRKLLYANREYVPYFTNLFEIDRYFKLHFDKGDWLCVETYFYGKKEITYPEFIKLFEGGETVKSEPSLPMANVSGLLPFTDVLELNICIEKLNTKQVNLEEFVSDVWNSAYRVGYDIASEK